MTEGRKRAISLRVSTVDLRQVKKLAQRLGARDSDVIKTYVRIGLGVGILASVAIDPVADADLAVLDAAHLFEVHTTWIGFRRGGLLRAYMYEFIERLAPHLPRKLVREAEKSVTQDEVDRIVAPLQIPLRGMPKP